MAAYLTNMVSSQVLLVKIPMRYIWFSLLTLPACAEDVWLPIPGIATPEETTAYSENRGAVELFVKTNYDAILTQIDAGNGPQLNEAFNLADVPENERPARVLQLQSDLPLYNENPGALVTALTVYGG